MDETAILEPDAGLANPSSLGAGTSLDEILGLNPQEAMQAPSDLDTSTWLDDVNIDSQWFTEAFSTSNEEKTARNAMPSSSAFCVGSDFSPFAGSPDIYYLNVRDINKSEHDQQRIQIERKQLEMEMMKSMQELESKRIDFEMEQLQDENAQKVAKRL